MLNSHHIIPFLVLSLLAISVSGQQLPRHVPSNVVFIETVTLPYEADTLTQVDVNYRIMKNFFVLKRIPTPVNDKGYQGGMELRVEFFDMHDRSRGRRITEQNIYSDSSTTNDSYNNYIEGSIPFNLPPGEYRFAIHLHDNNSQRSYIDRDRRIRIPEFSNTKPSLHDVVFVDPVQIGDGKTVLKPVNIGGNIPFGNEASAALSFSAVFDRENTPEITVTLQRQREGDNSIVEMFSKLLPDEYIMSGTKLAGEHSENILQYRVTETGRTDMHTAMFPMNAKTLEEGTYRLTININIDNNTIRRTKSFRVIWIDKPASLRNMDYAIEMLEYITTPEEYREIRRGSSDEREKKFFAYWRKKDPDPQVAYNPVMTVFYRRVDHATREFTTIRERNGARTDRGKIYIIYGPPTNVDRKLTPGQAPQETWEYEHLNQKFIFVDRTRQGNYRLVTREDL